MGRYNSVTKIKEHFVEQQNQPSLQTLVEAIRTMDPHDHTSKMQVAAAAWCLVASAEGADIAAKMKATLEAFFGKEGAAELIDALRGVVIRGFNLNGPTYHHDGHDGHYHVGHDRQPGRRSRRSGRGDTHNQVGHH